MTTGLSTARVSARIAVHGGAGTLSRTEMTPELEREYRAGLEAALRAGLGALERGTALDAVEAAVRSLEDCPLFNAGRGAVFNRDGEIEMDAAIMDGRDLAAGAVAAIRAARNPVSAARAVMERSPHVLLCGAGADGFARSAGLEIAPPEYFATERRRRQLEDDHRQERLGSGGESAGSPFGTVGAVAVDRDGHLAAATSTGGRSNKLPGRVGDTPVVGAGTWADDRVCAVSATGDGELFQRTVAAHAVASLVELGGLDVGEAAALVLREKVAPLGGDGGLIVLSPSGDLAMPFSSEGMYRGYADPAGRIFTAIWPG